jgi:hypothetical protein
MLAFHQLFAAFTWQGDLPKKRADLLLQSHLTEAQRCQYNGARYFDVVGGDTGHRYRIHDAEAKNVDECDANGQLHLVLPSLGRSRARRYLELFEAKARSVGTRCPIHYWRTP